MDTSRDVKQLMEKIKRELAEKERELIETTRKKNAEVQALKIDENQLKRFQEKVNERMVIVKQLESKMTEIISQKTHLMNDMRETALKLQQSLQK